MIDSENMNNAELDAVASEQDGDANLHLHRATEIARLATLDSLDYEAGRTIAAEKLNIRAAALDKAVAQKRRALGLDRDDGGPGQGRAVRIEDAEPWPEHVNGAQLADMIAAAVKTFVMVPDMAADIIALWVLHTWLVNEFNVSPRMAITSPTKGCGKTTVLRLLNQLTRRPKRTGSVSPPALFRAIEEFQPTILLDETDKYLEYGSDLHALLNEGHAKGAGVWRVLGEKLELREFAIYGAVAFAANGRLPDDLEQRSIVIEMQRRRAGDELAELREDRAEGLKDIASRCARWAADNAAAARGADPDMGALINRPADNWRPIFAIADLCRGDWPAQARAAAAALAPRESEAIGPMLLADVRAMFAERDTDKIASAEMCSTLHALEGRPWAEWKNGKPITPNQLARLLKPFAIISGTIRTQGGTPKGYQLHQFADAFERYLMPQGVPEAPQRHNADGTGTSAAFRNATPQADVADGKREKPLHHNGCGVVAAKIPLEPSADDDFAERAAILEFDGGLSREEAEAAARRELADDMPDLPAWMNRRVTGGAA